MKKILSILAISSTLVTSIGSANMILNTSVNHNSYLNRQEGGINFIYLNFDNLLKSPYAKTWISSKTLGEIGTICNDTALDKITKIKNVYDIISAFSHDSNIDNFYIKGISEQVVLNYDKPFFGSNLKMTDYDHKYGIIIKVYYDSNNFSIGANDIAPQ